MKKQRKKSAFCKDKKVVSDNISYKMMCVLNKKGKYLGKQRKICVLSTDTWNSFSFFSLWETFVNLEVNGYDWSACTESDFLLMAFSLGFVWLTNCEMVFWQKVVWLLWVIQGNLRDFQFEFQFLEDKRGRSCIRIT